MYKRRPSVQIQLLYIYKTCGTFGDRQVEYKQRTFKMTQTKNCIHKGVAEYQNQLGFITNLL